MHTAKSIATGSHRGWIGGLILVVVLCFSCSSPQLSLRKQRLRDRILAQLDSLPVDSLVRTYFDYKDINTLEGNKVVLLPTAQEKFDDLFEHIRQAKSHIHMEYFNFRNDSISHSLFSLLSRKASEGVDIRILFDAFGNLSNDRPLKNRHLDSLRQIGIQIVKFDPIRFPWFNHVETRDHRKLVVIDGKVAYLGGMNIADYYIKGLDKIGSWRDMHCRLEGPAVAEVQDIFVKMWHKATGIVLQGSGFMPQQDAEGNATLAVVDRSPKLQPDAIKDSYALAIAGAKREVNIVNPYFVPTKAIMSAINRAVQRGVKVNIMVSAKSDIPFTPEAMLYKLRKLAKRGVRVHLYEGGFHHAKVMTVDGRLSTVGSANLNSRSLRYDYETNVFLMDTMLTHQLDSIYRADREQSIPLDDAYWGRRSTWKKFLGWFANLFTPFL